MFKYSDCTGPKVGRSLQSLKFCLLGTAKDPRAVRLSTAQAHTMNNTWNTTFYMLERLVEQRKAITASNVELDNPVELPVHASHWAIAEKVVKALQVYEEAILMKQVTTILWLLLLFQL